MKILLLNPPIREWARPNVLPLGIAYVASVLRNAGHEVEVMDINAFRWNREEVEMRIRDASFDVAGIGAIVTVYEYVKWLADLIKRYHPEKKLVIGGSVGTSIAEIILTKTAADAVCMGEGEATAAELFETLRDGGDLSRVKGIWFRDEKSRLVQNAARPLIKDLNDIPLPAWDLFPMDIYLGNPVGAPNRNKWMDGSANDKNNRLSMNLCATRGCPYKCIYCYHDFMGPVYRHRSASNIIEEMKALHERYNVEYFHFTDDEFCLKKGFVYEFCEKVKKNFNGKVTWGCSGRVNLMTEDLIATMAESGCVLIGYGIESGSQKMLDAMKKAVTVEQAKNSIRWTEKYMGWADCSFIIGLPGEDEETLRETINFCKELNLVPEVIFFATPYPGTELYEMALARGKIADEEEYLLGLGEQGEKVRVNFTDFSDEELFDIQERMIQELDAWNKIKHPESR